jgi:two-component system, OmpR family, response regulator
MEAEPHIECHRPNCLNVLVVEDDVDTAESTAELIRLLGHKAQIARNGLSAVTAVVGEQFDLVLLDIGLPGLTGHDIARWVSEKNVKNPPFLVALTGQKGEEARRKSAECGIALHMTKPVDPRRLSDLLESI